MRKPFVAGNWKMNTTEAEAVALARGVAEATSGAACDVAVGVPFPHLGAVRDALRGTPVGVGAQDVHWEPKGAFTGEVSVAMLEDYCRYVIIGHSERRQFFGETDDWVNRKLAAVLASKLDPIVCVGELLEERRGGLTEKVLYRQLRAGLTGLTLSERVTIAYEPVWAIGTGETATPEVAQQACAYIRGVLREIAPAAADAMRIQYGGSVNAENALSLLSLPDIDGALVGGASLKADQFGAICASARA
ncbi:MAG: triose-phosphate isomerase [Dehalococcoidia bacterium]|uniref:triose-phosphate isomerase n=1 Tax=Candidatus Amarobacter glycogenicus TaxID=3140699 RepID=UPI003134F72B|nr:triose-phosphate isomerase [Dehalococcoidia bacterium]MBK7125694.1 triose-phosphate isomerase [Dehalococcoidia bacterium]MBK9342330.1 triose-phosphate isomerase [Dehalococcoidia bacterium]